MLTSLVRSPNFLALGIRIDRAPAGIWLVLLIAALWPTAWWIGRRMLDGSDEPLGLLSMAALGLLVWQRRRVLRASPELTWLALAMAGAALSTLSLSQMPSMASALLGVLALGAGLIAFLPRSVALAPVLGLSLLSLPLLASLQFYAGYPLRVITAEASRWLLTPGFVVERSGASLLVDGRLLIVDAPCSGVQMLWLGYFTACVIALHSARSNRDFLTRLPAVSALVLTGNVVRNTLLVTLEASDVHLAPWAHDGLGLLVLAAVCAAIAGIIHQPREASHV